MQHPHRQFVRSWCGVCFRHSVPISNGGHGRPKGTDDWFLLCQRRTSVPRASHDGLPVGNHNLLGEGSVSYGAVHQSIVASPRVPTPEFLCSTVVNPTLLAARQAGPCRHSHTMLSVRGFRIQRDWNHIQEL